MGQAIASGIDMTDDLDLAGIWRRDNDIDEIVANSDVLIDFSLPEATYTIVAAIVRHGIPLVSGVSGLSKEQLDSLDQAASSVAIVYDRNMSSGIALLENIVRQAAAVLGSEFAVQVHETHHVHKLDAPSGTALKLGEVIADARGTDAGDIQYRSERRGDVPGEHTVRLSSATEQLTLAHSVTTRQVFVDGALRAARWVVAQGPGRYSMQDVLSG
jgi:4-hydroxy-tetrahydrodipicolinate reductase